jgi:hypothetical protein
MNLSDHEPSRKELLDHLPQNNEQNHVLQSSAIGKLVTSGRQITEATRR